MTATLLYRIAAVVLVLFAAGHTVGFLSFTPPTTAAYAAREAMRTPFQVGGSTFSYMGWYTGFGLTISAFQLFAAYLAWHLGQLARSSPASIGALGWVFAGYQLVCVVLSWIYFSTVPAIFSAVLFVSLAWAAWLVQTQPSRSR